MNTLSNRTSVHSNSVGISVKTKNIATQTDEGACIFSAGAKGGGAEETYVIWGAMFSGLSIYIYKKLVFKNFHLQSVFRIRNQMLNK